jgi:hypothetical protein
VNEQGAAQSICLSSLRTCRNANERILSAYILNGLGSFVVDDERHVIYRPARAGQTGKLAPACIPIETSSRWPLIGLGFELGKVTSAFNNSAFGPCLAQTFWVRATWNSS